MNQVLQPQTQSSSPPRCRPLRGLAARWCACARWQRGVLAAVHALTGCRPTLTHELLQVALALGCRRVGGDATAGTRRTRGQSASSNLRGTFEFSHLAPQPACPPRAQQRDEWALTGCSLMRLVPRPTTPRSLIGAAATSPACAVPPTACASNPTCSVPRAAGASAGTAGLGAATPRAWARAPCSRARERVQEAGRCSCPASARHAAEGRCWASKGLL